MRKTFIWLAASAMICGSVWADICSDLSAQYASLLTRLQQETQAALSQTTDPAEQAAIRASFDAQKASLEAERDSVLSASNCTVSLPPAPNPGPNPGTGGTTPPPPPPPPPPVIDPGTGGTTPPTTGPGNDQGCKDLMDQVKTEAQAKAASGGRKAAVAYIRSRQAEIKALCGGDGYGRCHRKDDDKDKSGRDEHPDRCEKPEKRDDTPKCEPNSAPKPDDNREFAPRKKSSWDSRH